MGERRMDWEQFFEWLYEEGNRCEYPRLCAALFNKHIRISSTAYQRTDYATITKVEFMDELTRADQEQLGREALGKLRALSKLGGLL